MYAFAECFSVNDRRWELFLQKNMLQQMVSRSSSISQRVDSSTWYEFQIFYISWKHLTNEIQIWTLVNFIGQVNFFLFKNPRFYLCRYEIENIRVKPLCSWRLFESFSFLNILYWSSLSVETRPLRIFIMGRIFGHAYEIVHRSSKHNDFRFIFNNLPNHRN